MRFISNGLGFKIALRSEVPAVVNAAGGIVTPAVPMIEADFGRIPAGPRPHEQEAALNHFSFPGWKVEEDKMTRVDDRLRLGLYDTEIEAADRGWDRETKEWVENALLTAPSYGLDFIMVEEPRVPVPWDNYDEIAASGGRTTAQAILHAAKLIGKPFEDVLAYETQNRKREKVIDALLEAIRERDEAEGPREPAPEPVVVE